MEARKDDKKREKTAKNRRIDGWKDVIGSSAAILILVGVAAAVAAVISLFGGTIMKLFGFQYDTPGSVLLFFVITGIVGYPIDLITSALPGAMAASGILGKKAAIFLRILLDTSFTAAVMAVVDRFMDSVAASDMALFMVCFVFAAGDVWMEQIEEKEERSKNG